jgi:hypothetical protein
MLARLQRQGALSASRPARFLYCKSPPSIYVADVFFGHDSHDCCYVLSAGNLCKSASLGPTAHDPAEPAGFPPARARHSCCPRKIHGNAIRLRNPFRPGSWRHVGAASVPPPREVSPARRARPAVHLPSIKYRSFQ